MLFIESEIEEVGIESIGTSSDVCEFDFLYVIEKGMNESYFKEVIDDEDMGEEEEIEPVRKLDPDDIAKKNVRKKLAPTDLNFLLSLQDSFAEKTRDYGTIEKPNVKQWVGSFFDKDLKLKNLLTNKNQKLSGSILIFDLPAGRCAGTGSCPFV